MTHSAFIVDDEAFARDNLIDALSIHKAWSVIGVYSSGKNLIAEIQSAQPDVVFLDIQMPGDNGLTIARNILRLTNTPLIVFVTAYSDYAVTAFELYAIDYLLKPFDNHRVSQCIDKLQMALSNRTELNSVRAAQDAWAQAKPLEKLVIKSSASVRIIPTADIRWLAANGNYVDIHHSDGRHLLRGTLKHVLACLSADEFIQVHRGYAVRQSLIREVKTLDEERSELLLSSGEKIPVGKTFRKNLMQSLL